MNNLYKLGNICSIGSSKRIHKADYVDKGIPFYRSKEIIELSNGQSITEPLFISVEKYKEIRNRFPVPKKDDILITSVGTIGITYLVKNPNFYFKDGNLTWLRNLDKNVIDVNYLFKWLKSNHFKNQITNNNIGAVQKAITIDYLKQVNIPLPDLSTQKAIAKVLSDLDAKIELNNKINRELEAMAKTLYDYWFVQFDFPNPSTSSGQAGKPYKSSGGKMVYNEELNREIPEGWEIKELSEISNITMGQSPSGSSYNEDEYGEIFFQGSTDFGWRYPTIRQYTSEPSRMAKNGDILLSVRAPVGTLNIADNNCCIGRGLAALNSKDNANSYLFYVMLYFKQIFDHRNNSGTTFGSITKDDLFSLKVIYPKNELLKKYDNVVSKYNETILNNHKQNQQLTALRDWLLPMLMNGQVTVGEAEKKLSMAAEPQAEYKKSSK